MVDRVRVRTLRQHDGPEGQKWQGDEYERSRLDAEQLEKIGVVAIIGEADEPKSNPPALTPTPTPAGVKGEGAPANKAEPKPANKAEGKATKKRAK